MASSADAPPASEAAPVAGGPRRTLLRALASDERFTIVSNNCWGAHVYQALAIPYATPFVGLFIPPDDFLELARNFDTLIGADLDFVAESKSASVNAWRARERLRYPIGLLAGRVEIDFQHYPDAETARATWRRRCARINPDPGRRFFKFDDRENASEGDILAFDRLQLPHKVSFTARRHQARTVVVPPAPGEHHAPDGVALAGISRRYFNTLRWISARPAWLPLPSLV